nr:hypothetical protein [Corallococcus terminator]
MRARLRREAIDGLPWKLGQGASQPVSFVAVPLEAEGCSVRLEFQFRFVERERMQAGMPASDIDDESSFWQADYPHGVVAGLAKGGLREPRLEAQGAKKRDERSRQHKAGSAKTGEVALHRRLDRKNPRRRGLPGQHREVVERQRLEVGPQQARQPSGIQ